MPDRQPRNSRRDSRSARYLAGIAGALLCGMIATLVAAPASADTAALALDATTGQVLYAYQADQPRHPASLTKMMTLYLAFEALEQGRLKAGQRLPVSRHAANQRPSRIGLKRGQTISVEDAILSVVTKSANDSAVVLAEAMAVTETAFARRMTERARALGMTQTSFRNASGLHHRDQWTTARDMAVLGAALIRDYPDRYRYFSTAAFRWKGRLYSNHNALLAHYEGADGIKTGYIRQAGFNLTASAERKGQRVIGVILGGESAALRDWRMETLLDFGFNQMQADIPQVAALPYAVPPTGETAVAQAIDMPAAFQPEPVFDTAMLTVAPVTNIAADGTDETEENANPVAVDVPENVGTNSARIPSGNPSPPGLWAVQVGAYSTAQPAESAAASAAGRIPALLGDTQVAVIPVDRNGARIYRARLIGLNENDAREACRRLSTQRIPCLAVVATANP